MSGLALERRLVRLAFWRHDCRCGCRWRPLTGHRHRHTRTCGWCGTPAVTRSAVLALAALGLILAAVLYVAF